MFKNRFPFYYIAISALLGAGISYLVINNPFKISTSYASGTSANITEVSSKCDYDVARLKGFKHIRPLLFAEKQCESPSLDNIKQSISDLVDSAKASGKLVSASVYLRVYSKGDWTSYNIDERYHPASLSKVPILITYMHMAEKTPGLLDKKIFFAKRDTSLPSQYYNSLTLSPGHNYSVKELLRYMIAYSDNDATTLLWKQMNFDDYNTTFTDLNLPKPSYKFEELQLSAKEYATFFRALYNGSYLSNEASLFFIIDPI
jgi:beta-lactamase class A